MAHIPNTESDIQKVIRIAKVLDISIEEAAITCDAFHQAFSDDGMRRAIFDIVDQLDDEAVKKGEPLGLIINYTVELGLDGIRVGRYADEIPAGEVVELTPPHRANILLRINDNFPTHEFLGPLIVNRPELPSLAKEGWQTDVFCRADGVVCSEMKEPAIPLGPSSLEPARVAICLGPIRLKFNERFPCVSATQSSSQRAVLPAGMPAFHSKALDPPHRLPPWAALQAGVAAFQSTSGLSPPSTFGEPGTLRNERCPDWPLALHA